MTNAKGYLKDTRQFLQLLNNLSIPGGQDLFLVTVDVALSYTIIQYDNALLSLNWALRKREDLPFIQNKVLGIALDYCLSHNYFWYSGKCYTQVRGVAMGAKFAPLLANLFMSIWEDQFIYGQRKRELLFL